MNQALYVLFHVVNQINVANIQQHSLLPLNVHRSVDQTVRCAIVNGHAEKMVIKLKKKEPMCFLITKRWFLLTSPWQGSKSLTSNFKNVDFPTPFGPTMATRLLKSIPNSVFINNGG